MNATIYYGLVKKLSGNHPHLLETAATEIVDRISHHYSYKYPHLYYYNRIVIPSSKRDQILSLSHNHPLSGHLGTANTYARLKDTYYWPGMFKDVQEYVTSCSTCQKRSKQHPIPPTSSSRITPKIFHHIGIDIVGPLPVTPSGNRYIVVCIDFFSKYPEAKALAKADAASITQFIYDDIICRHGIPAELTSDRGTEFCNELIRTLLQEYNIQHIKTTAYHPQGNGQVERTNRTLKDIISKLVQEYSQPWDYYLSSALFALRTIHQDSTKTSPFEILHGVSPTLPTSPEIASPLEDQSWENLVWQYVVKEAAKIDQIRTQAHGFILQAQECQRQQANKKFKKGPFTYSIGDQVLLYRNMIEASWSAKLESKWDGPYYIANLKGTTIWLRTLDGSILPSPVHASHLKPYKTRPPPPLLLPAP
jgi:hypothetical protein